MNSLFALYCHVDDPVHFEEAIKDKKLIEVMDEEINPIERKKTWDLVELPKGKEVIGVKWIYKTKSNDGYLSENFQTVMKEEFEMTDMGLLRYFLGIEVEQNGNGIFISQAKYVNEVLERFNMKESKATITPTVMGLKLSKEDNIKNFDSSLYKSIVGSLMYLITIRPDIMHAVSLIPRFMERPKEAHWQAAKKILRYVKDDRKSTFSYVFHMGSGAISWASKKQPIVALSTTEAEYVAAIAAVCQEVWMRRMLRSLCQEQTKGTMIFCDNSLAIALSKNAAFQKRTKHINTKFHYIRELVNNGEIVLKHCRTQEQVADILTKPLGQKIFEF
eukprot:PITA_25355